MPAGLFTRPAAGRDPAAGGGTSAHRRPESIYHPVLDVWSVKQGSLRLIIFLPAVAVLVLFGLYYAIGAIIDFNQIDSDGRDMVTNLRMFLRLREAEHLVSRVACLPTLIAAGIAGPSLAGYTATPIQVDKSRYKLPDPRLLPLTEVVQGMVSLRDLGVDPETNTVRSSKWSYFVAGMPSVTFPAFSWDAVLSINTTFIIDQSSVLPLVQIFNALPISKRPTMFYEKTPTNDAGTLAWRVEAKYTSIERVPSTSSDVIISRPASILVETRFISEDVPATFIETDVTAEGYNNGQPTFKQVSIPVNESDPKGRKITVSCDEFFDQVPECRLSMVAPVVHGARVLSLAELYRGPISGAATAIASPLVASIQVEIRDMSQPRPYAPLFVGFGVFFFVGFGFLCGAIILLLVWWALRFHLVNKNVRENEGKPPMFYQGMLRFRGW